MLRILMDIVTALSAIDLKPKLNKITVVTEEIKADMVTIMRGIKNFCLDSDIPPRLLDGNITTVLIRAIK